MSLLKQHVEALIFCCEQSISLSEIKASLEISMGWELKDEELIQALEEIKQKYQSEDFAFELSEISEGYQFLTKKEFHSTVSALIQHKAKKKLSVAQMETLAIIAYKQPISKTEIEHIRGVNCDYAVQKLLEKDLIEIEGKSDGPGKPIIYGTSQTFMDYFGIKSAKDLPLLKDLHQQQNEIGTPNELAEGVRDLEIVSNISETDEVPSASEPVEMLTEENDFSSETVEMSDNEETIIVEQNSPLNIPDRKSIFMEHQNGEEHGEKEASEAPGDDEDLYS